MLEHRDRMGVAVVTRARGCIAALALLMLVCAGPAWSQQTCIWNQNGAAQWDNPSNWNGCVGGNGSPTDTPGPADHAVIGSNVPLAEVDVGSSARTVNRLTLSAGRVFGDADITVVTALNWTGGTIDGGGVATLLLLDSASNSAIAGSSTHILAKRDLRILGAVTWVEGDIELREDAEIDNQGQLIIDYSGGIRGGAFPLELRSDFSPDARIHNSSGALIEKRGDQRVVFAGNLTFDNGSDVLVNDGTLQINGAGGDFGAYQIAPIARLEFGTRFGVTRTLTGSSAIAGSGTLHKFDEGTLEIAGGFALTGPAEVVDGVLFIDSAVDPISLSTLRVRAPGQFSSPDNLEVTGALNWDGGEIGGTSPGLILTLPAAATATVTLDDTHSEAMLRSRNLINQGSVLITGTGGGGHNFRLDSADIDNQGDFELRSNNQNNLVLDCVSINCGSFFNRPGATLTFNDLQGIAIVGPSLTALNNDGLVELVAGCGGIGAPGVDTGTYRYDSFCTLAFFTRLGTERVFEETVDLVSVGGTGLQLGGSLRVNGLARSFGYLIIDRDARLFGPAAITFTDTTDWRGAIEGSASETVTVAPGATLLTSSEPTDTPRLSGRTLINDGGLDLRLRLLVDGNAEVQNNGVLNLYGSPILAAAIGCESQPPCGLITNSSSGTIRSVSETAGPTTRLEAALSVVNQGTLVVENGVLALQSAFSADSGSTVDVFGGAGLRRTAGNLVLAAGTLRGAGVIDADVDIDAVEVEPAGGAPGNLVILGNFTATPNSRYIMGIAGTVPPAVSTLGVRAPEGIPTYDRLTIAGIAALNGTLDVIDLAFPATGSEVFDLMLYASRTGNVVAGANPYSGVGLNLQTEATRIRLAAVAGGGCVWNPGGTGLDDWSNANKWDTCGGTVPGPGDTAIVGAGSVNLDTPVTVAQLQFTGGTIGGLNNLTISSDLIWTGGRFQGANGSLVTLSPGASGTLAGGQHTIDGRTFLMQGTTSWTTGLIELANGGVLQIATTGLLNSNPSLALESIFASGSGTAEVRNGGGIVKLGANTSGINQSVRYSGNGAINVSAGDFIFAAGSLAPLGGSYTAVAGASLQFVGGDRTFASKAVLGGSNLVFGDSGPVGINVVDACIGSASNVIIRNAQVVLNCAGPSNLAGLLMAEPLAVLEGSSAIRVTGNFGWGHGTIRGTGLAQTFEIAATANAQFDAPQGPTPRILSNRRLRNDGTISWIAPNATEINDGGEFANESGGQLFLAGSGARNVISNAPATSRMVNNGTLSVQDGVLADIDVRFDNFGSVQLIVGELRVRGDGNDVGTYGVEAGTLLYFDGATRSMGPGSAVSGDGGVRVINGASLTTNGTFGPHDLRIESGGLVQIDSASPQTIQTLLLQNGTLTGNTEVRIGTSFDWRNGGVLASVGASPGPVVIQSGALLDMCFGICTLSNRVLRIEGQANWRGGIVEVPAGAAGKITVAVGGTLTTTNFKSAVLYRCSAPTCTAEMEIGGRLEVLGDGADLELSSPLLINGGTLLIDNFDLTAPGVTLSSGLIEIRNNSSLSANPVLLNGGVLRAHGQINGDVNNVAGRVQPGASPGLLDISGTYTQGAAGILDIEVGGLTPGVDSDFVFAIGSIDIDGTLNVINAGFPLTSPSTLNVLQSDFGLSGTFAVTNVAYPGYSVTYDAFTATLTPTAAIPPVLTLLSRSGGPVAGGNLVTLTGSNFVIGATAVFFGATPATVVNCSSATQCTAAVPAGSGTVNVRVTTVDGSSVDTRADDYTYSGPATLCTNVAPASNFGVGTQPRDLAMGDFNGDGDRDLVTVNSVASGTVSVLLGSGTGSFAAAVDYAVGAFPRAVAIGDFNGDGNSDLAVANYGATTVSILLGTGAGTFGAATTAVAGSGPHGVAVGDFNADGLADLAVVLLDADSVDILLGNGDGTFGSRLSNAGLRSTSIAVSDFDRDGRSDFAVGNQTTNAASVALGLGTGLFGAPSGFPVGTNPSDIASGDFNGDGISDLAVSNRGTNNLSILLGIGSGAFGAATSFAVGTQPTGLDVGDFNGDGNVDLVAGNFGSANVSLLLGNGSGSFGAASNFPAGNGPSSTVFGDFNGDNRLDIAVANEFVNNVSILRNLGCPPAVTSISPTAGATTGGTVVTLTGSDFVVGATTVAFGASAATAVNCVSTVQCAATSPAGSGVVDVIATTAAGSSANTAADDFTYACPPTIVTTGNDSGPGSLRQIIADACPASVVTFAGGVTAVNLITAELLIAKNLTIDGGLGVTVARQAATPNFRIFTISAGSTVVLDSLSINNGNVGDDGGGIHNSGNLTVLDSVISGNASTAGNGGGGIANLGTLAVDNTTIALNSASFAGGGVLQINGGSATLTRCALTGNSAQQGGAATSQSVGANATLTISNCTISGNSATVTSPALLNVSSGAATTSNLTLTQSTIVDNNGPGGAISTGVNAGAATTTLQNNIYAGNSSNNVATVAPGVTTSLGNNLSDDATGGGGPADLINTDPLLAALANYGGMTQTHALLPGSPAINAANNAAAAVIDQRGIARPQQGTADIGAYESRGFVLSLVGGSPQTTTVSTPFAAPLIAGIVANGVGEPVNGGRVVYTAPVTGASASLVTSPASIAGGQSSVTATANGTPGSYSVTVAASGATGAASYALTNAGTYTVGGTVSGLVGSGLVLQNNAGDNRTITANGAFTFATPLADLSAYAVTVLTQPGTPTQSCSVANGSGTLAGANVTNVAVTCVAVNATVNSVADPGTGTCDLVECTLREAIAAANATAGLDTISFDPVVFGVARTITLTAGELIVTQDLNIVGPGAALLNLAGNNSTRLMDGSNINLSISGATLSGGNAVGSFNNGFGGAIHQVGGSLTLTDAVLSGNACSGTGAGGALVFLNNTVSLTRTTISGNSCNTASAISIENSSITIVDGTISGNSSSGSALILRAGLANASLALTNVTISGNSSVGENSAIQSQPFSGRTAAITLTNSTVSGNTTSNATGNGAIWQRPLGGTHVIVLRNSIVAGNTVGGVAKDIEGTLDASSAFNVIGTGGGLSNGVNGNQVGVNDPLLAPLANYGGATATRALLPGSPAINSGSNGLATNADQRGISRPQQGTVDVGAFESQGFVLALVSGSPQTTPVNAPFATPLVVGVTANDAGEPVNGGQVTYSAPGAGASAALTSPAAIVGSQASATATANGIVGTYSVTAAASGATGTAIFALTNGVLTTTTAISNIAPAVSVVGQPYVVTVSVSAGGPPVTTGTVEVRQLSDGSICSIDLATASSCPLVATSALTTAVRATYLGAGAFAPSQSAVVAHVVERAATAITIVGDTPDPSAVGAPITVTIDLDVVAPGAGAPSGEILVTDGIASCGITLPNLSCQLLAKAVGQVLLEARYLGDANFSASIGTEEHLFTADGADLAILKRNGLRLLPGGQPSTYVLLVTNAGPQAVVNARVSDILPSQFSAASWTCSASAGASCPATGTGSVDTLVNLAAGASVTFALTATAQIAPEQVVTNRATVASPPNAPDPVPGNNESVDVDAIGVFGEGFETEDE